MEKYFIPYEIALGLKELGFDEPCFGYFDRLLSDYTIMNCDCINPKPTLFNHNSSSIVVSAPLYQQAFRFLREKYELYYTIEGSIKEGFQYFVYTYEYEIKSEESFNTYEEAELACLVKLIEIVKEKK